MPLCIMREIRKTYVAGTLQVEVLKGIDLDVERGEFVAIMGASGSGKSTLMNLLGCLDVPTSGTYVLNGQEVSSLTDDELSVVRNEHVGFVFQSFHLISYATVLENVLLPSLYSRKRLRQPRERAMELLRMVGLEHRVRFTPTQLSGGEQQRTATARALMNDPDLLLADEPTGQLDSKTSAEIMALLEHLSQRGKTVLVVTHDPNVAAYASRVIRIEDGIIQPVQRL